MTSRWMLFVLCLWVWPLPACAATAQEKPRPVVLAITPYLPAAEIIRRYTPLATRLGQILERPVEVRVGPGYTQHIAAIGNDQVDIALLGPAGYVQMVRQYGRKPILARFAVAGQPGLRSVIAVRRDCPITHIEMLKGRSFAFGAPDSTTGTLLPRYQLLQAGLSLQDLGRYRHLDHHRDVALAVLSGDYDAGGLKHEVFMEYAPRGLRALAVSPAVPDYLFVARATLSPGEIERVRQALLNLHRRDNGRALLERMHGGLTALVGAEDSDYDPLRRMMQAVEASP